MFFSVNRCSSAYGKLKWEFSGVENTQKPSSPFSFPVCRCFGRNSWAESVQLYWVQTEGRSPITRHKE